MDKLDAVNLILDELGTHQVASIDSAHPDAKTAVLHIDRELATLLTRGYWFNTHREVVVAAQSNGSVVLSTNVLLAMPSDIYQQAQYVQQGQYMYDIVNRTRTIVDGLTLTLHVKLAFDDLPINAKNTITYAAASRVVNSKLSDTVKANELAYTAAYHAAELDTDEIRATSPNMFQPDRIANKIARMHRRS